MEQQQADPIAMIGFFVIFLGLPIFSILVLFSEEILHALFDKKIKKIDKEIESGKSLKETSLGKLIIHPLTNTLMLILLTITVIIGAFLLIILPMGGATLVGVSIGIYYYFKRMRKSVIYDLSVLISQTNEETNLKGEIQKLTNLLRSGSLGGGSHENN